MSSARQPNFPHQRPLKWQSTHHLACSSIYIVFELFSEQSTSLPCKHRVFPYDNRTSTSTSDLWHREALTKCAKIPEAFDSVCALATPFTLLHHRPTAHRAQSFSAQFRSDRSRCSKNLVRLRRRDRASAKDKNGDCECHTSQKLL